MSKPSKKSIKRTAYQSVYDVLNQTLINGLNIYEIDEATEFGIIHQLKQVANKYKAMADRIDAPLLTHSDPRL